MWGNLLCERTSGRTIGEKDRDEIGEASYSLSFIKGKLIL